MSNRPKFLEKNYVINRDDLVTTLSNIEGQLNRVLDEINSLNLNDDDIISYDTKLIPEGTNMYFYMLKEFYDKMKSSFNHFDYSEYDENVRRILERIKQKLEDYMTFLGYKTNRTTPTNLEELKNRPEYGYNPWNSNPVSVSPFGVFKDRVVSQTTSVPSVVVKKEEESKPSSSTTRVDGNVFNFVPLGSSRSSSTSPIIDVENNPMAIPPVDENVACPYCGVDLRNKPTENPPIQFNNCGHYLHLGCYLGSSKNGTDQCPLCYSPGGYKTILGGKHGRRIQKYKKTKKTKKTKKMVNKKRKSMKKKLKKSPRRGF
jgi:hypothetical protein